MSFVNKSTTSKGKHKSTAWIREQLLPRLLAIRSNTKRRRMVGLVGNCLGVPRHVAEWLVLGFRLKDIQLLSVTLLPFYPCAAIVASIIQAFEWFSAI